MDMRKVRKATVALSQGHSLKIERSPANAVVSLVCAIIPLMVYVYYLIEWNPSYSGDQSGWIVVIYYWTVGIPIFLVWLICGILGLNSKQQKLAIISLLLKPIDTIVLLLVGLIVSELA